MSGEWTHKENWNYFPGKWEAEFGLLDHSRRHTQRNTLKTDGKTLHRGQMLDLPQQDLCLHSVLISEWDCWLFIRLAKKIVMLLAGKGQWKQLSKIT